MRIVMAVMRTVMVVALSIIGAMAIVLAVDHVLFTRGTWSSWQLVAARVVGHDETA